VEAQKGSAADQMICLRKPNKSLGKSCIAGEEVSRSLRPPPSR
ncbi:hypothetical protein PF002_g33613, partial [Phytophthora fragariae]